MKDRFSDIAIDAAITSGSFIKKSVFAHAFHFFSVSIALAHRGELELGVVYDPMRKELFYAERNRGAHLNRRRIHVSKIDRISGAFLATGFSYGMKRKDKNVGNFRRFLQRTLAIRRAGSAALLRDSTAQSITRNIETYSRRMV